MQMSISTAVDQDAKEVFERFDDQLFKKLSPPFPLVEVLTFEGNEVGSKVAVELNFLLFKQKWVSEISKNEVSEKLLMFEDQGVELPFFLKSWRHEHIILPQEKGCIIKDQIHFTTGSLLTDLFMYPGIYLQFLYRKPIYKRFFS